MLDWWYMAADILLPFQWAQHLFMKNALTTGATWNSDHNGNSSGAPVVVRFKFTCANANATISVNGNNFINVYKITLQPQIGILTIFQNAGTAVDFYYAKGIGLVNISDPTVGDQAIRYWQVF